MSSGGLTSVLIKPTAGVLLPITALPSASGEGAGNFGGARAFIDFLADAGMGVWQMLPMGPTHSDLSPYLCTSSCAGNRAFIDLHWLEEEGWLSALVARREHRDLSSHRNACLKDSYRGFKTKAAVSWLRAYRRFQEDQSDWLDDFALFTSLRAYGGDQPWTNWDKALRDADEGALRPMKRLLADPIEQCKFEQFVFYHQWQRLQHYAHRKGVKLFGDMPLFVAHDSVEVWRNRSCFQLNDDGSAATVAGVPPDYFSQDGQCWGNPVYHWPQLEAEGFVWWIKRVGIQLQFYDLLRLDHFRGLAATWEIPAESGFAGDGEWRQTPGEALLKVLQRHFTHLPLVAEDLGFITDEVHQLRDLFHLAGMHVTQFAFDGSASNPHLLAQHKVNSVAYTGTHDNDTTLGWYQSLSESVRADIDRQLNRPTLAMPWSLIDYTLTSVAQLVVLPLQDILALDSGHRLNTPGTAEGNWRWQFSWDQIDAELIDTLRGLLRQHRRLRED